MVILLFTVAVNLPRMSGQCMVLIGTRSRSVKRAAVLTLQTTQRKNRRASRDPYEDPTLPCLTLLDRRPRTVTKSSEHRMFFGIHCSLAVTTMIHPAIANCYMPYLV